MHIVGRIIEESRDVIEQRCAQLDSDDRRAEFLQDWVLDATISDTCTSAAEQLLFVGLSHIVDWNIIAQAFRRGIEQPSKKPTAP